MGYTTPGQVRTRGGYTNPPYTNLYVNPWIDWATAFIDKVTGWWFEPRTFGEGNELKLDGMGSRDLLVPLPIIEITKIQFVDFPTIPGGVSEVDLDAFAIYNRHLTAGGLTNPDDRRNPRIAFVGTKLGRRQIFVSSFPQGRQNIWLTGRFGFTEPDFDAARSIASDALDTITAPDAIRMENGEFTAEDVGRTISIAGSASNDGAYVIATVVDDNNITTVEQTLTTEGTGFNATMSAFPQFGITPLLIKDVAIRLVLREMPEPGTPGGVIDGYQYEQRMRAAEKVSQEKVRDQSISFAVGGRGGEGNIAGVFTNDPYIDMILASHRRPPKMSAITAEEIVEE